MTYYAAEGGTILAQAASYSGATAIHAGQILLDLSSVPFGDAVAMRLLLLDDPVLHAIFQLGRQSAVPGEAPTQPEQQREAIRGKVPFSWAGWGPKTFSTALGDEPRPAAAVPLDDPLPPAMLLNARHDDPDPTGALVEFESDAVPLDDQPED